MNNVALIFVDKMHKDHVEAYSNNWIITPVLDADTLCKQSLNFPKAYPESSGTLPICRPNYACIHGFSSGIGSPSLGDIISAPGWELLGDEATLF
ncbi:MAG: hypothetical protein KQI62_05810 [Deltaproteobacteria bacterium]|nr:hypothetical protein [Deltaproteobacteria bacterium]